jgi:hypothetical protein
MERNTTPAHTSTDADAVLRVITREVRGDDQSRGPHRHIPVWHWLTGLPALSPEAHGALAELTDEAGEHVDLAESEQKEVLARIWWDDENDELKRVEWRDDSS